MQDGASADAAGRVELGSVAADDGDGRSDSRPQGRPYRPQCTPPMR